MVFLYLVNDIAFNLIKLHICGCIFNMSIFLTEQILKYLFDFKDIINNAILGYFLKSSSFPQYPINENLVADMRYVKVYTKLLTKNI